MTVEELMKREGVRNRLNDFMETGYDEDELVGYVNDSISFVWHVLIDNEYHEVIGDHIFTTNNEPVPDDWYRVTNQAPIIVKKGLAEIYGDLPQEIRYFRKPQFVTSLNDELPIKNEVFNNIIAQLIIIFAMSNHGFNMDVEQDFVGAIIKLL